MKEGYQVPQQFLQGVELVEKDGRGFERYRLLPGVYQLDFGFRNFGEHENDWRSGASDRESDRETPFLFDHNNPEVARFTRDLFENQSHFQGQEEVRLLAQRFGQLIMSMSISEPEYNNSLSDIVNSGQGMCDSKSVLFGSLIAHNTNLEAQAIIGQYGQVKDKVSYPFHHQWMRITDGTQIYLFDPMYERFTAFEQENDTFYAMDDGDSYFSNLTPACYAAGKLISQMNIQRFGGIRLVETHAGDGNEVYVNNEESLAAQLSNSTTLAFEIESDEELDIHDKAIRTGTETTSLYFPIRSFTKIE